MEKTSILQLRVELDQRCSSANVSPFVASFLPNSSNYLSVTSLVTIFCLGSFLLAEIILATIRNVKLLNLGFWPYHYCLELSPVFLNSCKILDTVLFHIDKFLVIPDTLTPSWNILHIAALTPSGI